MAAPHGTPSAQTTSFLPSNDESSPVIPAGFPFGTMIVRVLVANRLGVPDMRFAAVALSMFARSADAKTSAGAPCLNWSTRFDEPSNENFTVTPGWEASKVLPRLAYVSLRDDAANTTSSLLEAAVGVAAGVHAPRSARAVTTTRVRIMSGPRS